MTEPFRLADRIARYRTWGRWGEQDEQGSLNLITPDRVVAAAALIQQGRVFSLALPMDSNGPMTGAYGRNNPQHLMIADGGDHLSGAQDNMPGALRFTDDIVTMPLQCATQWDAFSHIFFDGTTYNGAGPESVTSAGASRNSITAMQARCVGRGVLLDVARAKGVDWLAPGYGITDADLLETAEKQNVTVGTGDFVLVRTGAITHRRTQGNWGDYAGGDAPGMHATSADFLCPRQVAAVATDTWGFDVQPNEIDGTWQPMHVLLLVNAGILIGEMWDLDDLAEDCALDGRYEFFLSAQPLTITGSVGSPLNPQAVK
jgi:kynurenine formamidase